jgi:hypothetical protein
MLMARMAGIMIILREIIAWSIIRHRPTELMRLADDA